MFCRICLSLAFFFLINAIFFMNPFLKPGNALHWGSGVNTYSAANSVLFSVKRHSRHCDFVFNYAISVSFI